MYCNAGCTNSSNWHEVPVGMTIPGTGQYEMFEYPALTFTSKGQPRIVAGFFPLGEDESFVHYLACDQGCEDAANWQRVKLWPRGQGDNPGWDVAVDRQDRPRIAYYPEALPDDSGEQLYYAWCDGGCLQAGAWQRLNLDLGKEHGGDPDIVFDDEGQPWIAFVAGEGNGVGLVACEANCTQAAGWVDLLMDSYEQLDQEWPVAYAPVCDGGLWNAWTPSLAFDRQGNLRIVYDATYHAYCWWNTNHQTWEEYWQFWLVQRTVRGVLITQQ
jgi:hypothetical protein